MICHIFCFRYGFFFVLHLIKNLIMKKVLLLLFVCAVSADLIAQNNKTGVKPAPQATSVEPPPPPQPPPPPPPPPAPPARSSKVKFAPPLIVNDKGYNLSVHYNNGKNIIYAKKNGVTEKVSMDKWNSNQTFYEGKYGKLPPPPPPPPAPAEQ